MFYGLVSYTNLKSKAINNFRRYYDPWVNLVEDHVTFIFPVPDSIGRDNLINHIRNILDKKKAFDIHIAGLEKSWDHFLLLTLKEGNDEVIELHDQLYTGILVPYLRKDIRFVPHIGLGFFASNDYDIRNPKELVLDEIRYNKAFEEAQKMNLDFWRKVEKLTLVMLDDNFTTCQDVREFELLQNPT